MIYVLIFFPILSALVAFLISSNSFRPWVLPLTGIVHFTATLLILIKPELAFSSAWIVLDPVSSLILLTVSTLYLICSFYMVSYLKIRGDLNNRFFSVSASALIGLMSLVISSHHLGLMWVAIEGTTLVSAPLIYFNHSKKSIEATWKYLIVGSVGIALALLGTFFLAYSAIQGGLEATLSFDGIRAIAPGLSKSWLHAAFILLMIGYGTKMGLAPMHTWKPDAYGEAPGVVGALLATGITSVALICLLRVYQIMNAAGESAFSSHLLVFMGLFSMIIAGIFMLNQLDFKRMLAYSSVEQMGILALGLGIGSTALFGTMLHIITNAMTKGLLFLSAGNIHRAYQSKSTDQVTGSLKRIPLSSGLFLAGFIAITGSPPFGPFQSIFAILSGAFAAGKYLSGALFLVFLLIVFVGMGITVLKVVQGTPSQDVNAVPYRESFGTVFPVILFFLFTLILGIWMPEPLRDLINNAVNYLENRI